MKSNINDLVTKKEFKSALKIIDNRFAQLEAKMYTKEDHAKFMVWMDEAMTELRDGRDERKLIGYQVLRIDDTVIDHEKRIRELEK